MSNRLLLLASNRKKPRKYWNFANGIPADLTHSRASNAMLTDATGKLTWADANMALQSNAFLTSPWSKSGNPVTANAGVSPDGSNNAWKFQASAQYNSVSQSITVVPGVPYSISIYAKLLSGSSNVQLQTYDGTTYRNTSIQLSGEWTRYTLPTTPAGTTLTVFVVENGTLNFSQVLIYGLQVEPTSYSSPKSYIATTSAAYYGPRTYYDPVTHASLGQLIEGESRQNRLTNSSNFSASAWSKTNSGLAASTEAAPDGSTMTRVNAYGTFSGIRQTVAVEAGKTYTASIFAKRGSFSKCYIVSSLNSSKVAVFDFDNPINTATRRMVHVGNGVYRLSYTYTLDSGTSETIQFNIGNYDSVNYNGEYIYFWGAQFEEGSSVSSYIPTYGTAVTRAADSLYTTNIPWFNPVQGTMVVEAIPLGASSAYIQVLAAFSNGSDSNYIANTLSASNVPQGGNMVADVYHVSGTSLTAVAAGSTFKTALSYKASTYAFAANGSLDSGGTWSNDNVPSGINRLDFFNRFGADRPFNGILRAFKYYNRALSAAELQRETTP